MRQTHAGAAAFTILFLSACATLVHGSSQEIGIASAPASARVTIDGVARGATPMVAKLQRGRDHNVRIELDGYAPLEAKLSRKVSGWVWGNLWFGGLIGLGIDALSGGLYRLTPEDVVGRLAPGAAPGGAAPDGLYVVLVKGADPSWTRVGSLRRE
ncbi:MAG: PEGA domain-containing protein [Gemmatimonadales bacterium]